MNKEFKNQKEIIDFLIKDLGLIKKTIHLIYLPPITNNTDRLLLEDPFFPEDEKIRILKKYPKEFSYKAINKEGKAILFTIRKFDEKKYDCAIIDNFGRFKFI